MFLFGSKPKSLIGMLSLYEPELIPFSIILPFSKIILFLSLKALTLVLNLEGSFCIPIISIYFPPSFLFSLEIIFFSFFSSLLFLKFISMSSPKLFNPESLAPELILVVPLSPLPLSLLLLLLLIFIFNSLPDFNVYYIE